MKQMRMEERPFTCYGRTSATGRTSVKADCPFCGETAIIFVWSFSGHGKKSCKCGAMFHRDGIARKLVETVASVGARLEAKGLVAVTADTITDEQIRELLTEQAQFDNPLGGRAAAIALGLRVPSKGHTKAEARARCAEILNSRNAVKP